MSRTTKADPALIPDIEAFEERVAIHIHESGIPTEEAKDLAAQAQGFRNQAHYWAWLRGYIVKKRLGGLRPEVQKENRIHIRHWC